MRDKIKNQGIRYDLKMETIEENLVRLISMNTTYICTIRINFRTLKMKIKYKQVKD